MRLLQLLAETRKRNAGIAPTVFLVSGEHGALDDAYRAAGARLIYGAPGVLGLWHLYRVCRQERPDIVHANVLLASGFHLFAAWLAGVGTRIAHMRNTDYGRNDWLFRRRNDIFRLFLNTFSTRIVGVCDAARPFASASPSRWLTIYNGLDTTLAPQADTARSERSRDELQIVFLGRLHPQKNPVRAVDIMAAVKRLTDGQFSLKIHGRRVEPLNSAVVTRIRDLGLGAQVEVCGETEAPLAALHAADVLLLTSMHEGLPGVVLEALSCGTPVVTSAVPGAIEIARFCEGVSVVDLAQNDEAWARALISAARADRTRIAKSFRNSPFTFERHYTMMMSLWKSEI
ncbi:glycosyltransferase [Rhizobium rhizoryzae]|uniref:glycosyltransferase n=1 Tax=Rhizobium rhizoryzae TaxID=451876 RepID=UPI0028B15E45|nr:glycosyltransferase [Rhizobium rhizoryzae]